MVDIEHRMMVVMKNTYVTGMMHQILYPSKVQSKINSISFDTFGALYL